MKLFVAKLNRDAVESDLLEWFGAMGPVKSAKVVMDRDTGQSKCFGFVEMESREGGERAIAEMNGQEFMGFRMVVKEAEDRGSRPAPRPGQDRGTGRPRDDRSARSPGNEPEVRRLQEATRAPSERTKNPPRKRNPKGRNRTNIRTVHAKLKCEKAVGAEVQKGGQITTKIIDFE